MNSILFLADSGENAAGVFFGFGIAGILIAIVATLFWIWMLIDALTNTSLDSTMKLVWAAVVFFLPVLGGLAYLLVGRKPRSA